MNIVRKDIDAVNATITIQVSKSDYGQKVENSLRDYRKKVNMPGFRPGMVPASLVKKMYGKAVEAEEINKLISESLFGYIKENNLEILGEPLPSETEQKEIDFDTQEELEFVFDLGLAPELDLKLDAKTKVPYYKIALTDEMIENQVKSYTGRFGSYIQVEEVVEKDVVKGDLVELTASGEVLEGGINVEAAVLCPAYVKDEKQKAAFIGAKIGDVITFNPKKAFENETEIASLLKVKKEDVAGIDADFSITITGITRYQESEINQELFDKVFGAEVVKSEEEFRAKIKESIQTNLDSDGDYKFGIDARNAVIKKMENAILPDAFLRRWMLASNEKLTSEQLDEEYPMMIEDLKWHLAKNQIAKANDVKVEFEDIEAYAKKMARAQFAQYGMPDVPEDILANYAQDMLKDENAIKNIMENVVQEKVVEIIKSSVKLDEKEIAIDDFNKMIEAK